MNICDKCKNEKLNQRNVKMNISIGYTKIGKCENCGKENQHLWLYEEKT